MWSKRDLSLNKSGVGNVFTKNLDKSIDNKALYDTFSAFGNILSCKIVCDEHGSRGYGFVHFETEEAARNAIENANGMLLNGKKVFVDRFMNRRERLEVLGEKMKKGNNVYVKNFGDDISEDELKYIFEPFGKLTSVKIMSGGNSRGFGIVSYEEPEAAEKAVEDLNGLNIHGRTLFAGRAQTRAEIQAELKDKFERIRMDRINKYQGVNLCVKNLDDNIDDERLRKEFSQFGTITSAKVMTEGGRSKGFGFVCFRSPEDATKAVTEMNGRIVVVKPLYVALAQRKEDRKAHLASQYMQRIASIRMQQVYQDRERHIDYRILENNDNTGHSVNEVQQFGETEDSQSSIQGATGYNSELVAEPLIAKEIESAGNGYAKSEYNTDDKYQCKICFDNPVEVTFLPCMHVCCCKDCSDKLKVKQCPICRKRIRQSKPLYFA